MRMSMPKRLFAIVMSLCLLLPLCAIRTANAAVTFSGIDTLMIYNPLIYYEQWVYDDYTGWEQNIVTNSLSTGNMSGQIKTSSGSVLNRSITREQKPADDIIRLTPQQVRTLTDNKSMGAADGSVESASIVRAVGDTKAFWIQPNLSLSSTRAKTTMTCRAAGTYCNIWGNSTFTDTSIASQMASQFDNIIYANDTSYFGSARFAEDGVKVNILVYTISYGGSSGSICGYFTGSDLYSTAELGSEAASYNADSPIVHLNSYFCNSSYINVAYVTMAHEFQHLICCTSTMVNPANTNEDELGTWLNESMSMQAEEISYPGEVAEQGYVSGSYNGSTDISGGQSLFCFDTNNDIGVYGQGFLFSEYLKKQYGGTDIFGRIHSTWRTCAANLLNDGADLETALNSTVVSAINDSVSYDSAIISAINSTDNSTDTTQDSVSVFLSKLNLNFQIATVLKESSGIHSIGTGCNDADPLLNTASTVSIQGGGRVWVKTADGNSYTVPAGADSKLIYVGFKNGEMVMAPTTASGYVPSTDPYLTLPATMVISPIGTGRITATYGNFTPTSFTWTSDTPAVATVKGNGLSSATITPVSEGKTNITCTASDGTVTLEATSAVTVSSVDQYRLVTQPTAGKQYILVYFSGASYYGLSKTLSPLKAYPYGAPLSVTESGENVTFTLTETAYASTVDELELTASANGANWRFKNTDDNYLAFNTGGYPNLFPDGDFLDWRLATVSDNEVSLRNINYTADEYVYLGWSPSGYFYYSETPVGFRLYEKVEPVIEGSYTMSIPASVTGIDFSGINVAPGASGTRTQPFEISCSDLSGCTVSVAVTSNNNWQLVSGDYSFSYSVSKTSFTFTASGTETGSCIIDIAAINALNLPTGNYQFTDSLTFTITATPKN